MVAVEQRGFHQHPTPEHRRNHSLPWKQAREQSGLASVLASDSASLINLREHASMVTEEIMGDEPEVILQNTL